MPNATITSTTFTGDGTQTKFMNEVNTAMIAAGFSQIDSFVATGNEQRVWQFDADPADTNWGKMIIHGGFSASGTIRVRGYSSYNPAGDIGTNESVTMTTGTISITAAFTLHICSHPEVRGVIIQEGTSYEKFFGYVRPSSKPTLWGEAPYGFIDSGGSAYASNGLQPISLLRPASVSVATSCNGYLDNGIPTVEIWQNRPFLTNCMLVDTTNKKPIAFFSNDVISVPNSGMAILQQFFDPTTNATYTVFDNISATASRMAIRTA